MAEASPTGDYPDSFRCPIGRSLMRDPVTAADGHSYERANIEQWFAKNRGAQLTSPMTGLRLPSTQSWEDLIDRMNSENYIIKRHGVWKLQNSRYAQSSKWPTPPGGSQSSSARR